LNASLGNHMQRRLAGRIRKWLGGTYGAGSKRGGLTLTTRTERGGGGRKGCGEEKGATKVLAPIDNLERIGKEGREKEFKTT